MSIQIPPAVNYQSPLIALPIKYQMPPREGPKLIPVEIDWGAMGGANNCVSINLQNNTTLEFSQIVAIAVDNSQCGSDVQFWFPDTTESTTIPAYTPKCIIEVFTNMTQFFVLATSAVVEPGDTTRFSMHNTLPPPIAVPITQEQNTAANNAINVTASGNAQIVPAAINGTLESAQVSYQLNSTATGTVAWSLQDGTGKVLASGQVSCPTGNVTGVAFSMTQMQVRFTGGIKFVWTTTGTISAGSTMAVNVYYRTP